MHGIQRLLLVVAVVVEAFLSLLLGELQPRLGGLWSQLGGQHLAA